MNPLTNMKNVLKLSEADLKNGGNSSWHDMYKNSAWIFVGGLPFELSEGDVIAVFSQYGEIVNINLVRDKITGKSKGFAFICYEDQRSTILSVDNLNGIKILNRTVRVDHVSEYKPPKENHLTDNETRMLYMEGCAPKPQISADQIKREDGVTVSNGSKSKSEERGLRDRDYKKEFKEKRKRKKMKSNSSSNDQSESSSDSSSDSSRGKSKKRPSKKRKTSLKRSRKKKNKK